MPFYHAADRITKELLKGIDIQTFWGDKMLLARITIAPGGVVPRHSHPHEQAGTVLEGVLRLGIDKEERALKPGDFYVIPGGVEHWVSPGDVRTVALDIFSPVREEYKY